MGLFDKFKKTDEGSTPYANAFKNACETLDKDFKEENLDKMIEKIEEWKKYEFEQENGDMEDANLWLAHAILHKKLTLFGYDLEGNTLRMQMCFTTGVTEKKPKDKTLFVWYKEYCRCL